MRSTMQELNTLARQLAALAKTAGDALPKDPPPMAVDDKAGKANFVTEYDRKTQEFLERECRALVPDAFFVGEESFETGGELPAVSALARSFIIDPIDGTTNFIRGQRCSAVSIGYLEEGEPVIGVIYNPWQNECFTAVKGQGAYLNDRPIRVSAGQPAASALILFGTSPYYADLRRRSLVVLDRLLPAIADFRRAGSAALDLAYVAAGRADGFLELRLSPWDYAAGSLLITEAGGSITDTQGQPLSFDAPGGVLAAADDNIRAVLWKALYPEEA